MFAWGFVGGADASSQEGVRVCADADAVPVAGGFGAVGVLARGTLRVSHASGGHVTDAVVGAEAGGAAVVAAALGWEFAVCACDDGTLMGWGWNAHGQTGADSAAHAELAAPRPIPCSLGAPVRELAAGEQHTLALVGARGAVFAWGGGSCGQLGHGGRDDVAMPRRVESLPEGVTALAAGARHSLAALPGAQGVAAFGWGLYGQTGSGSNLDALVPTPVAALAGLRCVGVAAGLAHSMVLTDAGDVYGFGHNDAGQLGLDDAGDAASSAALDEGAAPSQQQCALTPQLLEATALEAHGVARVCCGARHSIFLTRDGRLLATGWGAHGQLATGDATSRAAPTLVPLRGKAREVRCGWWHTLVQLALDDCVSW